MNDELIRSLSRIKLFGKREAPRILIFSGLGATVGGGIWACVNTYNKMPEVIEQHNERLEDIHLEIEANQGLDEKEVRKATTNAYMETTKDIFKVYVGPAIITLLGLGAILGGEHKYKTRSIEAAAAYLTLQNMYTRYRENVKEEYGEDVDYRMAHSIKTIEVEEEYTDKKGNVKTKKVKKDVITDPTVGTGHSDYARYFNESSREWHKSPDLNLMTLRAKQEWANAKLRTQGYLFLNDVYEMLDIPITAAGQQVGWIYDDDNEVGDNYVDFGIFDTEYSIEQDAINEMKHGVYRDGEYLLDFNVDGNILSRLPRCI